jgi:hypothetical protein
MRAIGVWGVATFVFAGLAILGMLAIIVGSRPWHGWLVCWWGGIAAAAVFGRQWEQRRFRRHRWSPRPRLERSRVAGRAPAVPLGR